MSVPIAYVAVILIWSTTPLGIVWSSESVPPTMAVLLRMIIAWLCGWFMLSLFRIKLPKTRQAIKLYVFSSIGIFGGMLCSYLAAQTLSSGLMSLTFGLSPILSGLLAQKVLDEKKFGVVRQLAMAIAFTGLILAFYDGFSFSEQSGVGIVFIVAAVIFFSISGVLVKSVKIDIHPLATTVGSLGVCLPLFTLAWWCIDGSISIEQWQIKSLLSIIYLGIFGSLIGFFAYFYVLQNLNASTVALITMITPIFALFLGAYLNNEVITMNLVYGAFCVMLGLGLYQWNYKGVHKLVAPIKSI